MFETLKVRFSLLSLRISILSFLFITLIYTMLSMFAFVKIKCMCYEPVANFGCLYTLIFSYLHLCIREHMSVEVEQVRIWITEAPVLFSSRQFWLLEVT